MGDRELKFVWFTSKDSRGTEGTGSSVDSQGEQQGLGHLSLFADQGPDQGMGLLQTERGQEDTHGVQREGSRRTTEMGTSFSYSVDPPEAQESWSGQGRGAPPEPPNWQESPGMWQVGRAMPQLLGFPWVTWVETSPWAWSSVLHRLSHALPSPASSATAMRYGVGITFLRAAMRGSPSLPDGPSCTLPNIPPASQGWPCPHQHSQPGSLKDSPRAVGELGCWRDRSRR